MQICGQWVNALGLLLTVLGVMVLLFSVGMGTAAPYWTPSRSMFVLGLVLLFVGFILQFIFAVCPLIAG